MIPLILFIDIISIIHIAWKDEIKMKNNLNVAEQLKLKYHKTKEVTNFKDMLYNSAENFKSWNAFKLKVENR